MPQALQVATVTPDDLIAFHLEAFGYPFQAPAPSHLQDEVDDEDDGLGYYSDGVKRTLTDAEIAIFRHSELHALRRQRERAREAAAEAAADADARSEGEASEGEILSGDDAAAPAGAPPPGSRRASGSAPDEDDDAAYAEFLRQERNEFERAAQVTRRRGAAADLRDRTVSTRRRVREMDNIADAGAVLDYGDGGAEEPAIEEAKAEGRKIWWPALGVKVNFFEEG